MKDRSFDVYTLKLKARKRSGYNAFIIPFAIKNDSTQLRAHIGSWLNTNTVFESVTNGFDIAAISESKRLNKAIDTARWYDITIDVGMDKVDCYLDGELLMTFKEPQNFFSIAGKDEVTGDIVVKVVNAAANPYQASISLAGTSNINAGADLYVLSAGSLEAENSFSDPLKYIPQHQKIPGLSQGFQMLFKPYSINVLRIHTKTPGHR